MRSATGILLCLMITTSQAQFKNVKLGDQKEDEYPATESSIAVNQKNPANIVATMGANRILYTTDEGLHWTEVIPKTPLGSFGDPTLISDVKGDLYYFHLSDPKGEGRRGEANMDRIVCQKSEDGGKSWSEGVSIGNTPNKDHGKPGIAIHPKKQILYAAWTQFDKYGSKDATCQSNILFSMSTNGGDKWSKPVQINKVPGNCLGDENTAENAFPAVGLDGKIYVAWSNQGIIYMDRSYDGGQTWLSSDVSITHQAAGAMHIPGFSSAHDVPVMVIDCSMTRRQGYTYMAFAHQKSGTDDTDILVIRSLDHGDHWTTPVKVNQDSTKTHQFMPSMAVDQANGNVYLAYYDRRAYDDLQTDVYLSYSFDGGSTFKDVKISEAPFTPSGAQLPGEYISISAYDGVITPIWVHTENGKASVMTTIIKEESLRKESMSKELPKKK